MFHVDMSTELWRGSGMERLGVNVRACWQKRVWA